MEQKDKDSKPDNKPVDEAPADALSMTPDELGAEKVEVKKEQAESTAKNKKTKKPSKFRRLIRKMNIYFLMFIIILVIAAAVAVITYLYSQKEPPAPAFERQQLTQEELDDLSNANASIGNARQQLTIKGNTIIDGHTLMRAGTDIAGDLQASGKITAPDLTIAGNANLGDTQINSLQVATNNNVQGDETISGNLSVAGSSTFNGQITASKITASELILSGNASLNIPHHLHVAGPNPGRTIHSNILGNGGSASVGGSDSAGTVKISSGNNPSSGCMVTISFKSPFTRTPYVVIAPVDAAGGKLDFYVKRSPSQFQICSANAPTANARFAFDYFITG